MRWAIASDPHANAAALRTVLADFPEQRIDRFVCLGDVVGYGPDAAETLELVHSRAYACVLGNHDAAVAGMLRSDAFSGRARASVVQNRKTLSAGALRWLRKLPLVWRAGDFACAHASFYQPQTFPYIFAEDNAAKNWACRKEQLLFVGHTHQSALFVVGKSGTTHLLPPEDFVLEEGKRYLVNPGSVGYPRTGRCLSTYCIYDDKEKTVCFRSLPFDLEGYHAKMDALGIKDAPWVEEEMRRRNVPYVRRPKDFSRRRNCAPWIAAGVAALAVFAGALCFTFASQQHENVIVTETPPEVVSVYPLKPPDRNFLGEAENLRFVTNETRKRREVLSPLFDLAGTKVRAVRAEASLRMLEKFDGNAQVRVSQWKSDPEGTPVLCKTSSFELRPSKKPLEADCLVVSRKVPLLKNVTHVRFALEAEFSGRAEFRQPVLRAEEERKMR